LAMGMYVMILMYVTCFGTRTVALFTLCFSWGAARALEVPVQVGPKSIYPDIPPPTDMGGLRTPAHNDDVVHVDISFNPCNLLCG
jgi:hypothetical protein